METFHLRHIQSSSLVLRDNNILIEIICCGYKYKMRLICESYISGELYTFKDKCHY